MKQLKSILILIIFFSLFPFLISKAQIIPIGLSSDSVSVNEIYPEMLDDYCKQTFAYYKATTYDPLTSPLVFVFHGVGGSGANSCLMLDSIAERRKALVVGLDFALPGSTCIDEIEAVYHFIDTASFYSGYDSILGGNYSGICLVYRPATDILNLIYKHILIRENISTIPVYLIGFSAGGQFVTRYMLIRQAYPDSIPIKMAVSSNPYFYSFPTDTFNGVEMPWLCGLAFDIILSLFNGYGGYCATARDIYNFNCNEHIVQYYNENYGVLIGSSDLQLLNDNACAMAQGTTRWQRAFNFYNFCDSNAVNRGTTLQWPYVEIPNVGHNQYLMYNTKASPTDTSTIAETLLFDTPYHTVPSLSPVASFYANPTSIIVNNAVNFFNTSTNATSYVWDFGDSTTSTLANPSHVYLDTGKYNVQLTAINGTGCDNWTVKRYYIEVVNPVAVNSINSNGVALSISPNPTTGKLSVTVNTTSKNILLVLTDVAGRKQNEYSFSASSEINIAQLSKGIYIYKVYADNNFIGSGKVIKE